MELLLSKWLSAFHVAPKPTNWVKAIEMTASLEYIIGSIENKMIMAQFKYKVRTFLV